MEEEDIDITPEDIDHFVRTAMGFNTTDQTEDETNQFLGLLQERDEVEQMINRAE